MSIFIVTDSTADFRDSLYDEYAKLFMVPLNLHIGDESYREKIDITNEEFYRRLRKEKFFSKTSQASAGDFLIPFEKAKAGDEGMIFVLSSHISGTYQSANMAAKILKERFIDINVIDTWSTSIGAGFMIEKACELSMQG